MKAPPQDLDEAYVVTLLVNDKVYIKMTRDDDKVSRILGFLTEEEAVRYYEESYNRAHGRGVTWSTGAMLHYIQTEPRIHRLHVSEIERMVGPDPKLHTLNGEGVHELGIPVLTDDAKAFHERGVSPRLIS